MDDAVTISVRVDDDTGPGFAAVNRALRDVRGNADRTSGPLDSLGGRLGEVSGAAGDAAGALGKGAGGVGGMGPALGIAAAGAITVLPAIGALVPMLVGLAAGGGVVALAFNDIKEQAKTLKPQFEDLQKAASAAVMPGVTAFFNDLKVTMKDLQPVVKLVGGAVSDFARAAGAFSKSPMFTSALTANVKLGVQWFGQFSQSIFKLAQSLLDFGAVSKPVLDVFGSGLDNLLSKGLPGFFTGLQSGIAGAAQFFRGLFDAVNQILPALGEFVGIFSNALGPVFKAVFTYTATTVVGTLKVLGQAIKFLTPVFGEMAGAARVLTSVLGAFGSIAANVADVVVHSLWPSFDGADEAVGPLQRLAKWFQNNQQAVQEFTRAASGFIIDFVGVAITQIPNVIWAFRGVVTGILTALDGIVSGAAHAFGWIPGLGDKLQAANRSFDHFKNTFIGGLKSAEGQSRDFAHKVTPRLQQNKLKMNIANWQSQITTAKSQLKSVPPSKQAALRATIADLQRKVAQAKREVASVQGKTVAVRVNFTSSGLGGMNAAIARAGAAGRASGGIASGMAHGGVVGSAASGGARGALTWVGEQGPELVRLPFGSRVHSNPDSQRMVASATGGGQVVQVNLVLDGKTVARALVDPLRGEIRNISGGNVQAALGRGQ